MFRRVFSILFIVTVLGLSPSILAAEPIELSDANQELLFGTWTGEWVSTNLSSLNKFKDSMKLNIGSQTPLSGKVQMGQGNGWETDLAIKDGKLEFDFGFARRNWTLEREGDGALWLTISYRGEFRGNPTDNKVKLRKQ